MSSQNMSPEDIYRLVQSVGKADGVLVVPKTFIKMFGSVGTAIFLSQLMQEDERHEGDHVYMTMKEWKDATHLSDHAIRKARKALKEQGIIDTKVIRRGRSPVVHVHLNKGVLVERMAVYHGINFHPSDSKGEVHPSISHGENEETYLIGNSIVSSIHSSSSPSEKKKAERISAAKEAGDSVQGPKGERKRPRVVQHAKRRATPHTNMVAKLGAAFRFPVKLSQKQRGRLRRLATRVLEGEYTEEMVETVGELWWTTWPGNQGGGNVPKDDQFMERLEQERVRRSKRRVVSA